LITLLSGVIHLILLPLLLQDVEEKTQESKPDETVIVVTCLNDGLVDQLKERVSDRTPAIEFKIASGDKAVLDILRTLDPAKRPDILYGVSTVVLARLADQGMLHKWTPDWARDLPVGLSDRDGQWFALFGDPIKIVYNSAYFGDDQELLTLLPNEWKDLGRHSCAGSLIFEDPTPYNVTGYFFACIVDRAMQEHGDSSKGFDLLSDIDRNILRKRNPDLEGIFSSPDKMLANLLSGEKGSISVAADSLLQEALNDKKPLGAVIPEDGLFLFPRGMALLKPTENAIKACEMLTDKSFLQSIGSDQANIPLVNKEVFEFLIWSRNDVSLDFFPTDHDSVLRNINTWVGEWQNMIRGRTTAKVRSIDDALTTVMFLIIPIAIGLIIFTSKKKSKRAKWQKR